MKTSSSDAYREYALEEALEKLIEASDAMTSAVELHSGRVSDRALNALFGAKDRLMDATSAAEKVLKGGAK
jgi:hypothetical protein